MVYYICNQGVIEMTTKQRDSVKRIKNDIFDYNHNPEICSSISDFSVEETIDSLKFRITVSTDGVESGFVLLISKGGKIYFNSYNLTEKIPVYVDYSGIKDAVEKKNGFYN